MVPSKDASRFLPKYPPVSCPPLLFHLRRRIPGGLFCAAYTQKQLAVFCTKDAYIWVDMPCKSAIPESDEFYRCSVYDNFRRTLHYC